MPAGQCAPARRAATSAGIAPAATPGRHARATAEHADTTRGHAAPAAARPHALRSGG